MSELTLIETVDSTAFVCLFSPDGRLLYIGQILRTRRLRVSSNLEYNLMLNWSIEKVQKKLALLRNHLFLRSKRCWLLIREPYPKGELYTVVQRAFTFRSRKNRDFFISFSIVNFKADWFDSLRYERSEIIEILPFLMQSVPKRQLFSVNVSQYRIIWNENPNRNSLFKSVCKLESSNFVQYFLNRFFEN